MAELVFPDAAELEQVLIGKCTGYRYADLKRYFRRNGFVLVSKNGSHRVWRHETCGVRAMVKDDGKRELLPVYVKDAAAAILRARDCCADVDRE